RTVRYRVTLKDFPSLEVFVRPRCLDGPFTRRTRTGTCAGHSARRARRVVRYFRRVVLERRMGVDEDWDSLVVVRQGQGTVLDTGHQGTGLAGGQEVGGREDPVRVGHGTTHPIIA